MANLLKNKAVWVVGGALGLFYMVPKFSGNSDNVFETPGVQNIAVNSEHFKDKHADQKHGEPGPMAKAWNTAHYGQDRGK
ncbi:hypothetical protein UCDDS831_g06172 [Diplodia seriata]|uniref:Uncharacterized protein n=1 Tax=Diplodia seriata TaxID=420778 RepID=A0A0G2E4B5_9PEZI|nr:hypothetical protein UCDDS831_g06172 [Diplodia seriata]